MRRVLFDTDPLLAEYSTFGLNEIVENYQYRKGKGVPQTDFVCRKTAF